MRGPPTYAFHVRAAADGTGAYPPMQPAELTVLIVAPDMETARGRASALLRLKTEWREVEFLEQGGIGDLEALPPPMRSAVDRAHKSGMAIVVFPTPKA